MLRKILPTQVVFPEMPLQNWVISKQPELRKRQMTLNLVVCKVFSFAAVLNVPFAQCATSVLK